jgi:excisionase family DNA binding protein
MARSTALPIRDFVSIEQAANYTGLSNQTLRRRIADGTLTGYRAGPKLVRVDLADVDRKLRPIATLEHVEERQRVTAVTA